MKKFLDYFETKNQIIIGRAICKKIIHYYPDNKSIKSIEYTINGKFINDNDEPAKIEFYSSGKIKKKYYYHCSNPFSYIDKVNQPPPPPPPPRGGPPSPPNSYSHELRFIEEYDKLDKLHRSDNKPSIIEYYESSQVKLEEYYNMGIFLHGIHYYETGIIKSKETPSLHVFYSETGNKIREEKFIIKSNDIEKNFTNNTTTKHGKLVKILSLGDGRGSSYNSIVTHYNIDNNIELEECILNGIHYIREKTN